MTDRLIHASRCSARRRTPCERCDSRSTRFSVFLPLLVRQWANGACVDQDASPNRNSISLGQMVRKSAQGARASPPVGAARIFDRGARLKGLGGGITSPRHSLGSSPQIIELLHMVFMWGFVIQLVGNRGFLRPHFQGGCSTGPVSLPPPAASR